HAPLAALLENVCAETARAGSKIGEIDLAFLIQALLGMFGNGGFDHIVHPFLGGNGSFDGNQLAVNAKDDRSANLNMHIRRAALHSDAQNAMKNFHCSHIYNAGAKSASDLTRYGIKNHACAN